MRNTVIFKGDMVQMSFAELPLERVRVVFGCGFGRGLFPPSAGDPGFSSGLPPEKRHTPLKHLVIKNRLVCVEGEKWAHLLEPNRVTDRHIPCTVMIGWIDGSTLTEEEQII